MSTSTETGRLVEDSDQTGRPSRRRGAIAVDVTLLGALAVLFSQTVDLAGASRHFPLVTLIVTSTLLLADLAIEAIPSLRARASFLEKDFVQPTSEQHEADAAQDDPLRRTRGEPAALVWLVFLGAGMYVVGYLIVTPVFLVLFSVWASVPVRVWVPVTVVLTLFNYFFFFEFLMLR